MHVASACEKIQGLTFAMGAVAHCEASVGKDLALTWLEVAIQETCDSLLEQLQAGEAQAAA